MDALAGLLYEGSDIWMKTTTMLILQWVGRYLHHVMEIKSMARKVLGHPKTATNFSLLHSFWIYCRAHAAAEPRCPTYAPHDWWAPDAEAPVHSRTCLGCKNKWPIWSRKDGCLHPGQMLQQKVLNSVALLHMKLACFHDNYQGSHLFNLVIATEGQRSLLLPHS